MRHTIVIPILGLLWGAAAVLTVVSAPGQDTASAPALVPPTPSAAVAEAKVTGALVAIEAAQSDLDAGDTRAAQEELQDARELLTEAQKLLVAARFANTRCPIMGTEIDPLNVPESRTRLYKGQVVAFSSERAVTEWDKLSGPEKDSKLAGASGAIIGPELGSKVINIVDPIDGRRIDPVDIFPGFIRVFRGQPIGFADGTNGARWERLSDAQKDALLKKALAGAVDKVVNALDPIDGRRIDPVSVPDDLIRVYRGYRLGFDMHWTCRRWDRLTTAQKDAALRAVVPGLPGELPAPPPVPRGLPRPMPYPMY
jgi:hypothetical protein